MATIMSWGTTGLTPAHAFHFMALHLVSDHQGCLKHPVSFRCDGTSIGSVLLNAQYLFCAFSDATQLICWRCI